MKMFIGGSGNGKTKQLISEAAQNNGIVVCKNPQHMLEKIHAYGFIDIPVISYTEFLVMDCDPTKKYYIRHIEELLEAMNIAGFTLTTN